MSWTVLIYGHGRGFPGLFLSPLFHWTLPAFNVADCGITIGRGLLILTNDSAS